MEVRIVIEQREEIRPDSPSGEVVKGLRVREIQISLIDPLYEVVCTRQISMPFPFEKFRNGLLAVTLPAGTQDVMAVAPSLIQLFMRQGKKLSFRVHCPRFPLPLPRFRICFHQAGLSSVFHAPRNEEPDEQVHRL